MTAKTYEERAAEWIEKATEVPGFDGPVYCPWAVGPNEGYFESVDDLCEHLDYRDADQGPTDWPKWAFCCTKDPIELSAEHMLEEGFEWAEAEDALKHVPAEAKAEFFAAVERFNAAIAPTIWRYSEGGHDRKVAVPSREEWDAPAP